MHIYLEKKIHWLTSFNFVYNQYNCLQVQWHHNKISLQPVHTCVLSSPTATIVAAGAAVIWSCKTGTWSAFAPFNPKSLWIDLRSCNCDCEWWIKLIWGVGETFVITDWGFHNLRFKYLNQFEVCVTRERRTLTSVSISDWRTLWVVINNGAAIVRRVSLNSSILKTCGQRTWEARIESERQVVSLQSPWQACR